MLDFSKEDCDGAYLGVQYPSVVTDGKEIAVLVRAALNHADNFPDANYLLFLKTTEEEK